MLSARPKAAREPGEPGYLEMVTEIAHQHHVAARLLDGHNPDRWFAWPFHLATAASVILLARRGAPMPRDYGQAPGAAASLALKSLPAVNFIVALVLVPKLRQ